MNEFVNEERNERITRALEAAPTALIAEDFAARVMHRLPARPVPSRYAVARDWVATDSVATYVGRRVALGALVFLTALMFWLAPHAFSMGHGALTVIELLFCAEFVGVVLWLSPLPMLQR